MTTANQVLHELITQTTTGGVLLEVLNERLRQENRWGPQDHKLLSSSFQSPIAYGANATFMKSVNDRLVEEGAIGWDSILLEEVYEALAETDPVKARAELIQCAAVCVAMIESLDRNELAGKR